MAAMLSSHTAVGWLATRSPPGSASALALHSGLTYPRAPTYGFADGGSTAPTQKRTSGADTRRDGTPSS
jgi:hypothetical protein